MGQRTAWAWIYGRVATALGCLPSAIDDEPVVNIFELLEYWAEEPPAHVTLAIRYLGQRKKVELTEEQAENQMRSAVEFVGPPKPMPERFKDAIAWAEEFGAKKK